MLNGILCFTPPHILKEIVKNGNNEQRAWALQTLVVSEQFRGRRQIMGGIADALTPAGQKSRTIFDGKNTFELPGTEVRLEGRPNTNDPAVDEAYDGLGSTYDFYYENYKRNSIDDRGMRLDATVHYGRNYNNAFWNGSQMVFGDGDGEVFQRFTKSMDIIAHELTHGVVQFEANLAYWEQSGALNEHFADVFGSLVKQYIFGQTAKNADWLIGANLFTDKIKGKAIRSMKEPGTAYDDPLIGKDPQPSHMKDYVETNDDNGGVHINSGIPNHAFYLTVEELGQYSWEKAGKIWYIALRDHIRRKATFQTTADQIYYVAGILFGEDSEEQKAVANGWNGVGIKVKDIRVTRETRPTET